VEVHKFQGVVFFFNFCYDTFAVGKEDPSINKVSGSDSFAAADNNFELDLTYFVRHAILLLEDRK
jgi:hypothetical protein